MTPSRDPSAPTEYHPTKVGEGTMTSSFFNQNNPSANEPSGKKDEDSDANADLFVTPTT